MSVVNKMLRDLDDRGFDENGEVKQSVKNANYIPESSSKRLYSVIACLAVVCIVAASYSVYLIKQPALTIPSQAEPSKIHPKTTDLEQDDRFAAVQNKGSTDVKKINYARQNEDTQASRANTGASDIGIAIKGANEQVMPTIADTTTNKVEFTPNTATTANEHVRYASDSTQETVSLAKTIPDNLIKPMVNLASPVVIESPTPQADNYASSNVRVAPSDGAKTQLSTLRAKAAIASKKDDDLTTIRLLKDILNIAPQETDSRKKLASLLFSNNQLSEAQQVLAQGIEQTPADSSLRLMLSRLFFKLGDNNSAFEVLSKHPYNSLANDDLVSFRAALAEKVGQYENAQKDYQILIQRNPSEAKWWLGLGVSQDKQKLSKQAISSYQQAQSLNQLSQQINSFMTTRIQLLMGSI